MSGHYQPRAFTALPAWQIGEHSAGLVLKPYLIVAERRVPDAALLDAAQNFCTNRLPDEAMAEGGAEGPGFAILHLGTDADWLLCDWWVNGDSLAQRLARADCGSGEFVPLAPRPLLACVWEMVIHQHERAAWITAMMQPSPDPAAYLANHLPNGMY